MDENQQPSITQKRGRLFSTTRGGGRRGQSRELFNFGVGESSASAADKNNTSFAIPLTTKWTIEEIWEQKQHQRNHASSHINQPQEKFPIV